jgi:short-subunit dehydrogenase
MRKFAASPLAGKVVLLTGGSRGLGPIIAQKLAERGASLALCARSAEELQNTAAQLQSANTRVEIFPADLIQGDQRQRLIAEVLQTFGNIDVLINNAGLITEGSYADLSLAAIRETIEINLIAAIDLTQIVLPSMVDRKDGHIVNISSIAGKTAVPYAAVYSSTKAGLAAWARALRLELAGTGVTLSTIFPGYVTGIGKLAQPEIKPPLLVGSCTSVQVADSIVVAIERKRLESVINFPPLRLSFLLNEISPTLGDLLMRVSGIIKFQQQKLASHRHNSQ